MYAVNSITLDLEDAKAESKGRFFKFHESTSMYHLYHNMFIPANIQSSTPIIYQPIYLMQFIYVFHIKLFKW